MGLERIIAAIDAWEGMPLTRRIHELAPSRATRSGAAGGVGLLDLLAAGGPTPTPLSAENGDTATELGDLLRSIEGYLATRTRTRNTSQAPSARYSPRKAPGLKDLSWHERRRALAAAANRAAALDRRGGLVALRRNAAELGQVYGGNPRRAFDVLGVPVELDPPAAITLKYHGRANALITNNGRPDAVVYVLNNRDPGEVDYFLAHELAHHVLGGGQDGGRLHEGACDVFAEEFLVAAVRDRLGTSW